MYLLFFQDSFVSHDTDCRINWSHYTYYNTLAKLSVPDHSLTVLFLLEVGGADSTSLQGRMP